MSEISSEDVQAEATVAQASAYETIRARLDDQAGKLDGLVGELNQARLHEFGSSEMSVLSRTRVRTENNCVPRDLVQVGDYLVFGYNVFIGLKKETHIEDVFALFKLEGDGDTLTLEQAPLEGSFLSNSTFVNEFKELYLYYKNARLLQLTVKNGKLLAGFQIGERLEDIRVFRWSVSADGSRVDYIDNRGERDIQLPPAYDFEWVETTRDDTVSGRHPHVNILDKVFVETLGGTLTVKVEDNTEDGLGIFSEPVEDETQSIDDASIFYAGVGDLVLLRVLPYRETDYRYLVFNSLTGTVTKIDAIGQSCIQLPEDHGIIFPGGYYLQSGEYKTFDDGVENLRFKRVLKSPNGEDVLFVFYEPEDGVVGLLAYNLIEKEIQNPLYANGYALSPDGTLVVFSAEPEATRVHPMQLWQTPFVSEEYASAQPSSQTFYGRIGNSELVRGVSDLYSVVKMIKRQEASARIYEEIVATSNKLFDQHFWFESEELSGIAGVVREISATAELVIDEFEKVRSIRAQTKKAMSEAGEEQEDVLRDIQPDNWESAEQYVGALQKLRQQRGHLVALRDLRYVDADRIQALDDELVAAQEKLNLQTVEFLTGGEAFEGYHLNIADAEVEIDKAETRVELSPIVDRLQELANGLDLLSEIMNSLKIDDANVRTEIVDSVSTVYAKINQSSARAESKRRNLGSSEATAQFGAQFKLFSQSVTSALSMANTPDRCDEQLGRLLIQLEELESQFSDFDQFLNDINDKREEIYESFESHKQRLLDERERSAQVIVDGAERMLASVERRTAKFTTVDELNTFLVSDTLVAKIRESVGRLHGLESRVKAEDIETKLKSLTDNAVRALRDKTDIYEADGSIIKLGPRHRFNVNQQELDLTIVPRDEALSFHLIGTNYFETVDSEELQSFQPFWQASLESESDDVYRAEYLAYLIFSAARLEKGGLSMAALREGLVDSEAMAKLVRDFAEPRYKEGYQKGIHDHDATLILTELTKISDEAGLLSYSPRSRGLAQIFWANVIEPLGKRGGKRQLSGLPATWRERSRSAYLLRDKFTENIAIANIESEIDRHLESFLDLHPIGVTTVERNETAAYLVGELGREKLQFIGSAYAQELVEEFKRSLNNNEWCQYQEAQDGLRGEIAERWKLSESWLEGLVASKDLPALDHYIPEAVALLNAEERLERRPTQVDLEVTVSGLLGEHQLIQGGELLVSLDRFLLRMREHEAEYVPAFNRFHELRQEVIKDARQRLRLNEYKAKPLSSFVRNKLINDVYLPIIGDNLAKQMGTAGDDKRTDLMGLLMMISPPGYGKTTLMEYVADRLGLIFMKINCPSLGHSVESLDPTQAPHSTAALELEKLNLSFEMGNNVMLYLDDIQHTHPEFLQKFISLCDGTRRIEGVWKGETKTYDMRGRRFCVVMAGNPYTESGELFKVPDMLANRADIYNLGDILGGKDEQFALSYIENSLTSNPILAPLATRDLNDVYRFVDMAKGEDVSLTDLSHQYSSAEAQEIVGVLQKMFVFQELILKVNQQYIASAAQNEQYRIEPAFKLQGSYRNMNKLAEKVSAVMNDEEQAQLISDHYLGESQLLTTGAEENLLKLAELRGRMSEEEQARWDQIKKDFMRAKAMGGDDANVGDKIVVQLVDLVEEIKSLGALAQPAGDGEGDDTAKAIGQLAKIIQKGAKDLTIEPKVEIVNPPPEGIEEILKVLAETWQNSLYPLVRSMDKKIDIDLKTRRKTEEISNQLLELQQAIESKRED